MLSFLGKQTRLRNGVSRRDWLRLGGLGAFALSVDQLSTAQATETSLVPSSGSFGKAKRCIVLFMLGGPPQLETCDPKPDAPKEIRGEFGRSPKINARGGRDHWGHCFSVALAGGGVKGGVVHGQSDRHAGYHCLGIPPETTMKDPFGRPLAISTGKPITAIL